MHTISALLFATVAAATTTQSNACVTSTVTYTSCPIPHGSFPTGNVIADALAHMNFPQGGFFGDMLGALEQRARRTRTTSSSTTSSSSTKTSTSSTVSPSTTAKTSTPTTSSSSTTTSKSTTVTTPTTLAKTIAVPTTSAKTAATTTVITINPSSSASSATGTVGTPILTTSSAASSTAVPTALPPVTGNLITDVLSYHNYYRALHSAPALVWNNTIAQTSNNASYYCVFQHQTTTGNGENLAQGFPTAASAITAWYNEISDYAGGWNETTGHYTQLVWASTTQIGCVLQSCAAGPLLRCEYYPQGNIVNYPPDVNYYFRTNVLPLVTS